MKRTEAELTRGEAVMRRELRTMLAGFVVAGAFVVGVAGAAQAACEPDKVATKYPGLAGKTLKVGLDPTLPPVMYRDPNNPSKIIGQDPDMSMKISSRSGGSGAEPGVEVAPPVPSPDTSGGGACQISPAGTGRILAG